MNYLLTISLRNLLRQKRRNILLGIAVAFGTAILVLANSFSRGISDVLFNEIVVYVAGHMKVSFNQDGNVYNQVFKDGDRMLEIVDENVPDLIRAEEAIGIMARAIGNGKADNVIMVGMDMNATVTEEEQKEYEKSFKIIEGSFEALEDSTVHLPVGLAQKKAEYLNLKLNDVLRVRFTDINGMNQSARLTVAAIFKPANVFMSAPIFLELQDLKEILGYGPHDIAQLNLTVENPKKNAVIYADSLHNALTPSTAAIEGSLHADSVKLPLTVYGFRSDSTNLSIVNSYILPEISKTDSVDRHSVLISRALASKAGLDSGNTVSVSYKPKHSDEKTYEMKVTHILPDSVNDFIMANEDDFYETFYSDWPQTPEKYTFSPSDNFPLSEALAPEWILLERARTTEEVGKRYREVAQKNTSALVMDVQSMYESASAVLKLEQVLNLITFSAVIILFFIILIGVINTLRMTIKERTREIGTIRAIGMQRNEVRNVFLLETGMLALFSSLIGTVLAFVMIQILSLVEIEAGDNPMGMLLSNGHLNFASSAAATVFFILLIIFIAVATAFFPARKAAKLSAADALRHFE
ncbi:MAG: ABC transporter permease [Chitinispirillaceae bacterium]